METIHLDTHAVVWLFQKDLTKLPSKIIELLENNDLLISPMVILELEFLYEIGRLKYQSADISSELFKNIDLRVSEDPFSKIANEAINQNWTRDPLDRLIVANPLYYRSTLISKCINILSNYCGLYDKNFCDLTSARDFQSI